MEKLGIGKKQVIVIVLLVVSFLLVMDLNTRLSELFRLSQRREQIQTEVDRLESTRAVLMTQIAYATSDEAVKEWAREQGGMAMPGDIPIIPLAPKAFTPVPLAATTPVPPLADHWQKWWALFFGQ